MMKIIILNKAISFIVLISFYCLTWVNLLGGENSNEHIFYKLKRQAKVSREKEIILLDNLFIQSYKKQIGLWYFIKNKKSAKTIADKNKIKIERIYKINNLKVKYTFYNWLFVPYSETFYKDLLNNGATRQTWSAAQGEFIWPVLGSRITGKVGKRWGIHHRGLDIATGSGNIVLAAQRGVITRASLRGGYGIMVSVKHDQGYTTHYAHLFAALGREGDKVRKGQIIGLSGNSGRSTGPHLHFEVECEGVTLDPRDFLPQFKRSMKSSHNFHTKMFTRLKVNSKKKSN